MEDKLEKLRGLKDGWDGYNAPAIPDIVIDNAKRLHFLEEEEAEVFPTGRSSVQIEFKLVEEDVTTDVEIEVFEDRYEFTAYNKDNKNVWEFITDHADDFVCKYFNFLIHGNR